MLKLDKLWIFCFVFPFFADRLTKYVVMHGILQEQSITSFLEIYLTYNRGVSLSIASFESDWQFNFVTMCVIAVLVLFTWYAWRYFVSSLTVAASWMVLSGGISNLIDRVLFGGVVDFLHVHYGTWSFPVFNVADVFITCGTFLLLCTHLTDD